MNESERVRILPCGDAALTVEFGSAISEELNDRVLSLDKTLRQDRIQGVFELVPTYRALCVHYDPALLSFFRLSRILEEKIASADSSTERFTGKSWKIPVCYGGEHGIDLEMLAARAAISVEDAVALHAAPIYRVYMMGFSAGFTYMGGLNEKLACPRRSEPRLYTPGSSITIGGNQTAIQSLPGPTGWHLVGRTPVRPFQLSRDPMFLFQPGDKIKFYPVTSRELDELDRVAAAGKIVAECEI